jgi:hypothetical protein
VVRGTAHAGLLIWCLVAAFSTLRYAESPSHPVADLDAEFRSLVEHLPSRGVIGFLDPHEDATEIDGGLTWFIAQYALAPRVVVSRVGPEFVIVARGTARPGGDSRLDGYAHVTSVDGDHRLYRRVAP